MEGMREAVRDHYDKCSWLYLKLWGPHIHHGYWDGDEPAGVAQIRLVEELARAARIEPGSSVLDAGCGLAGSGVWLAENRDCTVTGVTISPAQARLARRRVKAENADGKVDVLLADLESLELPKAGFDAVWSVECTEHLSDKEKFIAKAAGWLKPGGVMAFCAWTPAHNLEAALHARHIRPVCEAFVCPSLASRDEYAGWMEWSGLRVEKAEDWTGKTLKTWEICLERTDKWWVRAAARWLGPETRLFLNSFQTILDAYRSGALEYSVIVARKPA